jgi:hypothetical protein
VAVSPPEIKGTYLVRYLATLRGTLRIEADSAEEAREKAENEGYDAAAEQTDFEILSVREES